MPYSDSLDRFQVPGHVWSEFTYVGDGVLFNLSSIRIRDVFDGTSNTFFVGEGTGDVKAKRTGLHFTWYNGNIADMFFGVNGPCSLPGDGVHCHMYTPPASGFSSYHSGGCNFLRVDGSVNFVSENTDQFTLEALCTRFGEEVLEEL